MWCRGGVRKWRVIPVQLFVADWPPGGRCTATSAAWVAASSRMGQAGGGRRWPGLVFPRGGPGFPKAPGPCATPVSWPPLQCAVRGTLTTHGATRWLWLGDAVFQRDPLACLQGGRLWAEVGSGWTEAPAEVLRPRLLTAVPPLVGHGHHHWLRGQSAPDVGREDHCLLLLRLCDLLLRASSGRCSVGCVSAAYQPPLGSGWAGSRHEQTPDRGSTREPGSPAWGPVGHP